MPRPGSNVLGLTRAEAARRAAVLASPGWQSALAQYARATSLSVTLYDAAGHLLLGPFTPTPLAEQLVQLGGWQENGPCLAAETEAARAAEAAGLTVFRTGLDALSLFAVPVRFEGEMVGAIAAGWAFETFPDPVLTDRLAKRLGVTFPYLWHFVRQQSPASHERLATYAELLDTLADSFLRARAETLEGQERLRGLHALNESGRRLAGARDMREIARAVAEASLALSGADTARLLVADERGTLNAVCDPDAPSGGGSMCPGTSSAVTSNLRVPVEGDDGSLLGMIEISAVGGLPTTDTEQQLTALASQAALALQKVRLIADLERERAELTRSNRAKDEFLSVLSHELRTPLTPILGWVDVLRQHLLKNVDGPVKTALETIERNARQEIKLVEEMLDLSRIINHKVHLKPELVAPQDALAAALSFTRALLGERPLHLALELEEDLPLVSVDPQRLQQVLSNLIVNAAKFTPDGGEITLGARRAGLDVEFWVRDTGIGIDPQDLPYIFDRFRQADSSSTRRFGGLGIGLSVVRGLVEMQGGRVRAESGGVGQGTMFVIRFPAAGGASALPAARRPPEKGAPHPPPAPVRGKKVLLVDDSPDTLEVIQIMLEIGGYEVAAVDSAAAALDAAHTFAPQAVICDIGMPEMDGFELLKSLHADPTISQTPVIALTGFASDDDREAVRRAGFNAYLTKPVEPQALLETLERVLADDTRPGAA